VTHVVISTDSNLGAASTGFGQTEGDADLHAADHDLTFLAPLSQPRAQRLVACLTEDRSSTVPDVGCGWGELLLRVLEAAPAGRGLGVDLDESRSRRRSAVPSIEVWPTTTSSPCPRGSTTPSAVARSPSRSAPPSRADHWHPRPVHDRRRTVMIVVLVLAWGSTFAAVKVGLEHCPAVLFGGIRSVVGGFAVMGLQHVRRHVDVVGAVVRAHRRR
jgi:hypothetical protein